MNIIIYFSVQLVSSSFEISTHLFPVELSVLRGIQVGAQSLCNLVSLELSGASSQERLGLFPITGQIPVRGSQSRLQG